MARFLRCFFFGFVSSEDFSSCLHGVTLVLAFELRLEERRTCDVKFSVWCVLSLTCLGGLEARLGHDGSVSGRSVRSRIFCPLCSHMLCVCWVLWRVLRLHVLAKGGERIAFSDKCAVKLERCVRTDFDKGCLHKGVVCWHGAQHERAEAGSTVYELLRSFVVVVCVCVFSASGFDVLEIAVPGGTSSLALHTCL